MTFEQLNLHDFLTELWADEIPYRVQNDGDLDDWLEHRWVELLVQKPIMTIKEMIQLLENKITQVVVGVNELTLYLTNEEERYKVSTVLEYYLARNSLTLLGIKLTNKSILSVVFK